MLLYSQVCRPLLHYPANSGLDVEPVPLRKVRPIFERFRFKEKKSLRWRVHVAAYSNPKHGTAFTPSSAHEHDLAPSRARGSVIGVSLFVN